MGDHRGIVGKRGARPLDEFEPCVNQRAPVGGPDLDDPLRVVACAETENTAEEVAASIKQKLSLFIRDPHVTVIVTGLRSHEFISRVRVTGAVRQSKSMAYRDGMTVLDAVLEAGGVSDFAAPNRTKLYRKTPSGVEVIPIKLENILNKGKLDTNEELKPGDIVTVPERLF